MSVFVRAGSVLLLVVAAVAAAVAAADDAAQARPGSIAEARDALLREFTPPPNTVLGEEQARAQDEASRRAVARIQLVDVPLRFVGPGGAPIEGLTVRALHVPLDLSATPATTDAMGRATVRLMPGDWRVDVAKTTSPGKAHFGRFSVRVDAAGAAPRELRLAAKARLHFTGPGGALAPPRTVTLATPDSTFRADVDASTGRLEVTMPESASIVVQATRPAGAEPGFVLRRTIGPGATAIDTAPPDATTYTFDGSEARPIGAWLLSTDALPYDLGFEARREAVVHLSGLPETLVGYHVSGAGGEFGFHPTPLALDGKPRVFDGRPPLIVTVGRHRHTREAFGDQRGSASFQIFLRDANGLLVHGDSNGRIVAVDWEARAGTQVLGSGTIAQWYRGRLPPMDDAQYLALQFRLRVTEEGAPRDMAVVPHDAIDVGGDELVVKCYPELAPSADLWRRRLLVLIRAFRDVAEAQPRWFVAYMSDAMPPGLCGLGGWWDDQGWIDIELECLYGFRSPRVDGPLIVHEFTHAFHLQHGTEFDRTGPGRAARRYSTILPGTECVPAGDRFRAEIERITRGEQSPTYVPFDPARPSPGPGAALWWDPGLGEDQLFEWWLRQTKGTEAYLHRRRNEAEWSWWLVARGFSEDEILGGILSYVAGENLAWLVRVHGGRCTDARVDAAWKDLAQPPRPVIPEHVRTAVRQEWESRDFAKQPDLVATAVALRWQYGDRERRAGMFVAIARAHLARGETAAARESLEEALREAWLHSDRVFHATLDAASQVWAQP